MEIELLSFSLGILAGLVLLTVIGGVVLGLSGILDSQIGPPLSREEWDRRQTHKRPPR